jgi:hypothetical protein
MTRRAEFRHSESSATLPLTATLTVTPAFIVPDPGDFPELDRRAQAVPASARGVHSCSAPMGVILWRKISLKFFVVMKRRDAYF